MAQVEAALLRRRAVEEVSGLGRSTLYAAIADGRWTKPVRVGLRAVAWPRREVEAINAARIAGKTDDELRALVAKLTTARSSDA